MKQENQIDKLNKVVEKYVKSMDAIYNHNETARVAVVAHFGIRHPKEALAELEDK